MTNQKRLKLLCQILTVALAALVLGVIAFAIYLSVGRSTGQEPTVPATETVNIGNKDELISSAHAADNYSAFLQVYEDRIAQTQSVKEQAYIYSLRASDILSNYYNQDPQGQYKEQAVADVLKAYKLTPTASAASDVAVCYTWVGEPELAAEYYAIAEQDFQELNNED